MYECQYPNLFKPLKLGNTILRNRIFAAPTGYCDLTVENIATEPLMAYYESKARGGCAVVHVGEAYIDSVHGVDIPKYLKLDSDDCVSHLATVADAINKHGAIASIELMHAGMFASQSYIEGHQVWAPSDTVIKTDSDKASARLNGAFLPEMPEEEILNTIELYAQAAKRVQLAGFKMVLLHGGHGWLLHQFMSPLTNHRTDKWGGSAENRCRFAVMVCDRIKEVCGKNFMIDFRMSASEVNSVGYGIENGIECAKQLDGHCDIIHCSVGNHEVIESFVVMHPSMFLEDGVNMKFAAEVKKYVKTPVAAVGSFSDPAMMEKALADGLVDVIEIGRGVIADPDLPNKARMGKADEINQCLRCYTCFSQLITTGQYGCAINPTTGRELECKYDTPPVHKRNVVVVGGGIGGMEAARVLKLRGHNPIIHEKSDVLGGTFIPASAESYKGKLRDLLDWYRRQMTKLGIEVRLNDEIKDIAAFGSDPVIIATGSTPRLLRRVPGYEKMIEGCDYLNGAEVGNTVAVIGGGLTGCEIAYELALQGKNPIIVEMKDDLISQTGVCLANSSYLREWFALHKTPVYLETTLKEVKDGSIVCTGKDGKDINIDCDSVISCAGYIPAPLAEKSGNVHLVGDCLAIGNLRSVVWRAYDVAMKI